MLICALFELVFLSFIYSVGIECVKLVQEVPSEILSSIKFSNSIFISFFKINYAINLFEKYRSLEWKQRMISNRVVCFRDTCWLEGQNSLTIFLLLLFARIVLNICAQHNYIYHANKCKQNEHTNTYVWAAQQSLIYLYINKFKLFTFIIAF